VICRDSNNSLSHRVVLAIAAVFSRISPNKRPFSPVNPSISYPYLEDTISITTVGLVGVVAPAAIIFLVCLVVIAGPSIDRSLTYPDKCKARMPSRLMPIHSKWSNSMPKSKEHIWMIEYVASRCECKRRLECMLAKSNICLPVAQYILVWLPPRLLGIFTRRLFDALRGIREGVCG